MTTAHERKQQERKARRRRIQQAARTVFANRGYAKTSIEQIAREASLSVGAIYLYFRSKEDLYVSLLEETLEGFEGELGTISGRADSADERLGSVWTYLTDWATRDVEATRVLRLASQPGVRKQLSDEVAQTVGTGLTNVRGIIEKLVAEGTTAGQYDDVAPTEATDLVWSLFLGVLLANDARDNLGLPGQDFNGLANSAFMAVRARLGGPKAARHAAA